LLFGAGATSRPTGASFSAEAARLPIEGNGKGRNGILVDDVEEMRHYLAQRHQELALDRVDIASNVRSLETQLAAATADFDAFQLESQTTLHALELVVSGKGRGKARIEVATARAGWVSSYDVSWDENEAQLQISRFARVVQTTGQPWKNVALELRTGQPLRGAVRRQFKAQLQSRAEVSYDGYCANVQWVNSGLSDARARQDVLTGQGALASNWRMAVADKVDVAGTGEAARVFLDAQKVEATPRWEARPATSEEAIRACDTHAWMGLKMLSGEGRMFQGNAMVGVLPLNMPSWGDSLHVELGFDEGVRTTATLLQDESGTRRMSGKRVIEQVRLIAVHNAGKENKTVRVVEDLPMAPGWEMEVEATGGGVWDADAGEVTWLEAEVPADGVWEAKVSIRIVVPKRGGHVVGL
ncbi:MAG: DUF4139 domain-containing protein, partial [Flavobacteriales bacterium]|nr:DUF4139 domain-containing protein [Flavobacteriales bacterium]